MTNPNVSTWLAELAGPFEPGTVVLAGAGPGDPGLISLKAAARLSQCDTVLYDQLANPELLSLAPDDAERVYVGKAAGLHSVPQDQLNQRLVDLAHAGRRIVRLKGGDPFVFGRGGEEAEALAAAGVRFEIIPGITAAVAAPAYAGIPVTHRDWTSTFALVTGHEDPTKADSNIDFAALARIGTVAFYMGVRNLAANCEQLVANGLAPDTPAAVIRCGTSGDQRTLVATVSDIAARAAAEGITPPAMTIIGRVVGLRDRLNWFEALPLFGQTVVITRTRHQSSALASRLRAMGASVLEAPTIALAPPDNPTAVDAALKRIASYDWLVLTSVNGVDVLVDRMRALGLDARALGSLKLAAIGSATGQRLREHFLEPDVIPEQFVAESLAAEFTQRDMDGKRVLMLRADIARPALRDALRGCGAMCDDVAAYATIAPEALPAAVLDRLEAGTVDWITFTSSSTFANFVTLLGAERLRTYVTRTRPVRLASIGPITSKTIRDAGFEPAVEAIEHTIPGLVQAMRECGSDGCA
ncbi:MAG: uroporphyrinogen-III C-methyltransferase [Phycisphaerae bacterium]|nr:uroporphyrinogen-III C-methyltransferase [Phycisphaerae bacterium]